MSVDNIAYRISVDTPWATRTDWGRRLDRAEDAGREWRKRAQRHRPGGFRSRERGKDWDDRDRSLGKMFDHIVHQLRDMKFGDVLIVQSTRTRTRWLIRKVHVKPEILVAKTIGDDDVDFNHGLIFKSGKYPGAESWGIRNDRYISGTTIPSAHWARKEASGKPCEARAEDFHHPSMQTMWSMARDLAQNGRCGKILFAGHEWLPQWGAFRFVGSYIGHYDHPHAESRDVTGILC